MLCIETKDLRKKYASTVAVDGVDLQIESGQVFGFLGPNGAGKSTLLSLISGDNLQAYANQIYLFGRRRGTGESVWDIKQQIGLVSSEYQVSYRESVSVMKVVLSGFFDTGEYDVLILASIVEKETGIDTDRPMIASVFHNRIKRRMRLDSDPTVIYGLKDFNGNLTRKHLRTPTPYNTYRRYGLPPTPISNPGKASIHSVLYPAKNKFLYFVARGDGSSKFSKTLREHNKAVWYFQKVRKKHGDPEVLKLDSMPVPEPNPGEVLIRVAAAGVNRSIIHLQYIQHCRH